MTIRKATEIAVQVRWKKRPKGRYATLRWSWPRGQKPEGEAARSEHPIGYVTAEQAEDARVAKEAELRLGLGRPSSSRSSGYTVAAMMVDHLAGVEASPASKGHKDRVAGDCSAVGRILGAFEVDDVGPMHVKLFIARRSVERVVRARRRKDEPAEPWHQRKAAARLDPKGERVHSTTVYNELRTLRRAMIEAVQARPRRTLAEPIKVPRRTGKTDERAPRKLMEIEATRLIAAAPLVRPGAGLDTLMVVGAWSARRPGAIFNVHKGDCARLLDDAIPRKHRLMLWRADKSDEHPGLGPVTEPAYRAILQRLAELGDVPDETPLWTRPNGKLWTSNTWPNLFAEIAAVAGVADVVFYDLRKHACSQVQRRTSSAAETMKYSGHKNPETLMRHYVYSLEDAAEELAERIDWTPAPLALAGSNPPRTPELGADVGATGPVVAPTSREKAG